jgi:hypothetical protein
MMNGAEANKQGETSNDFSSPACDVHSIMFHVYNKMRAATRFGTRQCSPRLSMALLRSSLPLVDEVDKSNRFQQYSGKV